MWRDLGKCGRLERDQQDVLNAEVTGLIRHAVRGPTDNAVRRFQHKAIALERRRRLAALAGLVGGLLVTITGINLGMGGPASIKAFMMIMIGGAGVISGAIAGGFILGMMESVGLTVLSEYGDITYLVIFASLMVFLSLRPQGLMGKPWG